MSGDWWTRTTGLAGCLEEPPHPSVTVTSNTVDYSPTQKFSFSTTADPQEKEGMCPKSERKVIMEHLLHARHCARCFSFPVTSPSCESRFYSSILGMRKLRAGGKSTKAGVVF